MDYHQFTITISGPYREMLTRRLMELGSLGAVEHDASMTAYFPGSRDPGDILKELDLARSLLERLDAPVVMDVRHSLLPGADWNESWKKSFPPADAGERFTVIPPWIRHEGPRVPIIIEPGMAFGTGHHETTRSCIVLMERYAPSDGRGRFLDLGTGTGLLAIAAWKLGFREVAGVDTDPLAVEAARRNLALNQAEAVELYEGDISSVQGDFDMIAANLISGMLIELAKDMRERLRPGGVAVLAGILKAQEDEVIAAMHDAGLVCIGRLRDGKWVSLACRR